MGCSVSASAVSASCGLASGLSRPLTGSSSRSPRRRQMDVGQKGGRAGSGEQQRPFGDAFVNLVLAGGAHRCVAFFISSNWA